MTSGESLTERNRAVITRVYDAVKAGDVETLFRYCSDDVVVSEPAFLPFGREYRGKEEFLELFPAISQYLDVSQTTIHFVIADGDKVVGCIGIPDLQTGQLTRMLELFTLCEGKVTHIQLFYFDAGTIVPKAHQS